MKREIRPVLKETRLNEIKVKIKENQNFEGAWDGLDVVPGGCDRGINEN